MRRLWVYKFEEKKSWSLVLPKGTRMQKIEVEIQKKIWFSLCPLSIFNTSLNVCTNITLDFYNRIIKSNDAQQAAPWVVLRQLLLWEKAAWGSEEGLLLETFFPWSPPALKGRAHEIFRSNLSQLWWFPPTRIPLLWLIFVNVLHRNFTG